MANRWARSMNRGGDQLLKVLGRLAVKPMPPAHIPQFKAPYCNGQGDFEYFINRFEEITEANVWGRTATHFTPPEVSQRKRWRLWESSKHTIYAALRAIFEILPQEARTTLSVLRKEYWVSLQEHAAEVEKLTTLAQAMQQLVKKVEQQCWVRRDSTY